MLDATRYQRAKSIFFEACEQPRASREEFVQRACSDDAELLAQVRVLLAGDDDPLSMMDAGRMREHLERLADSSTAMGDQHAGGADASADDGPLPSRIGRYRVLGRLGAGGMGVVYLAEQEHPRRRVALKVVSSVHAGRQAIRRFEHEAQILGRLHHPGIAQVYEAGVHDAGEGAQPFFAMELVCGEPLTRYCDRFNTPPRERLRLFIELCEAVQHAHQHGVVHRDLKPANILVETGDPQDATGSRHEQTAGAPTPPASVKVLDFGVARLIDSDVQATTMHTAADQLIGTVAYMSPEQMSGRPEAIDTRSDVYALGVILYELLARRLPHDVAGKTIPEMIRTISESEPTSLSGIDRALRGDLETIVGKAMERDPARRYASASELAADVRRYLNHEPIHARPPSGMYQARKFAQRNKALVGGVAAVMLALVGGIIATTWQARQAIAARDEQTKLRKEADDNAARATAEAQRANAANAFLARMLASANPDVTQGRDVLVSEVLDAAAKELRKGALGDQPDVQIQVCMTIGGTYQSIGRLDDARQHFEQALRLARREPGRRPAQEAAALQGVAMLTALSGDAEQASHITSEALTLLQSAYGEVDREDIAMCLASLGDFASSQGRQAEAIDFTRQSLEMHKRLAGEGDEEVAERQARLAGMLHDPAEAEPLVRAAMTTFEQRHGQTHPAYINALRTLADMQTMRGEYSQATATYRRALELGTQVYGRDHHRNLLVLENLSFCMRLARNAPAYAEVCDEMLRMTRQLYPDESMRMVEVLIDRGDVRSVLNQPNESEADYREAAAMAERLGQGADFRACSARLSVAAMILQREGDLDEAQKLAESVLALKDQFRGQQRWLKGQAESVLGEIELARNNLEDALRLCLQGYQDLGTGALVRPQRYLTSGRIVRVLQALNDARPGGEYAERLNTWTRTRAELAPANPTSMPATQTSTPRGLE